MHRHCLLTAWFLIAVSATEAADSIALTGATLIPADGRQAIENGVVVIRGRRIECAGTTDECAMPEDAERIDFYGHYITPGLVDAHVHQAQTGWIDGRPDGISAPDIYPYDETIAYLREHPGRWHASWLCTGITAVFDAGGQDWTVTGAQATETERPDRAHVRAAGPLITHAGRNEAFLAGDADQPLFLPMGSDAEALASVAHVVELGAGAIKVWYLDPPAGEHDKLDARLKVIGEAAREAGVPLLVHATELRNAKAALRAGANMLVHSVEDAPVDAEFLELLASNDAVYAPTLLAGRNWTRAIASIAFGEAVEIDDPNGCVDEALLERIGEPERLTGKLPGWTTNRVFTRLEQSGAEVELMFANLRAVHDAGATIATATDAGNPLTVHGPSIYQEMEAMQAAGLAPEAIIEMSTRNGAMAMGRLDRFGTLEAGKSADLLVLARDPRESVRHFRSLTHVMRAGRLHEQNELRVR